MRARLTVQIKGKDSSSGSTGILYLAPQALEQDLPEASEVYENLEVKVEVSSDD